MQNNLNKWFDAARQAKPVVHENEIDALLNNRMVKKSRWTVSERGLLSGLVLFMLLSGLYWGRFQLHPPKDEQQSVYQAERVAKNKPNPLKQSVNESIVINPLKRMEEYSNANVFEEDQAIFADTDHPQQMSIQSASLETNALDLANRILYLDEQELKALGIAITKGAFNYYYKTYSFNKVVKATQLRGGENSFYFVAGKPGKNYFIKPWEADFHPLYLTDSVGNHQRNFHFQDRSPEQGIRVFNDSLRELFVATNKDLIPVGIRTPEKGCLELLWYEATPAFIKKLPTRYETLFTNVGSARRSQIRSHETNESGGFDRNIYLDYEELAALGIKTDGNTLTYATITDTVIKIEDEGREYAPSFKISIEKHGSSSTVIGYDKDGKISEQRKLFWPAFIQTISNKDTTIHLVEYLLNGNTDASHFFEETKDLLIPVEIQLKAKPGRWSDDLTLIFWFKPETAFLAALPSSIRQTLRGKEIQIDTYHKIFKDYRLNHKARSIDNLSDSVKVSQQSKKARSYTDDQLKDIFGIHLTTKGFVYSNTIKMGQSKIKVKVGQVDFSTFTDINKTYFAKVGPKNYTACAMTHLDMDYIHYLYVYPDSVSRSQQERESVNRFKQDVESLVPVVLGGVVLWFPPHPELLRRLRELKQ